MASRSPPEPIYVLRGTSAAINVLKFASKSVRDDGLLLSGSSKGFLSLWSLKTKRTCVTLDGHEGKGILAADILPCGKIISHGRDGCIKMWQCSEARSEVMDTLDAPFLGFCQFSILPKGENSHWIALPSPNKSQVNILDLESKKPVCTLIPDDVKSLGVTQLGSLILSEKPFLAAGFENGSVILWDVTASKMLSNKVVHSESVESRYTVRGLNQGVSVGVCCVRSSAVLCMDVDKKNLQLVTGSADNKLYVSTVTSECILNVTKQVELKNPGIASVRLRKDWKIVATGGWDGRLRVYGWKKLSPLAYLNYHTETINSVDFSDDFSGTGQILAAGGKDSRISLWSLYNNTSQNK